MDGVASLRIGWDEVRPHVPRVITFDKLSKLREAVTTYAAALATDDGYRDSGKVSPQLATWYLNGKSFAQHWGVAPANPDRSRS
jgi:hypothetical protein